MTRLTLPAPDTALMRREQMLNEYPELRISAGSGFWQAEIMEPGRKTVITRYELGDLLDYVQGVLAARDPPL
jgi:hypothetical protein